MKTTIKGLIKQHLIKVCKEKTAIMRERIEVKPKKQFSKKKIDEAVAHIRTSLDQKHADSIMNAMSVLLDAPELSRQMFQLEIFGAVVLAKNGSSHPYQLNVPHIVTKTSPALVMYTDGKIDCGYTFGYMDDPRPATDEEIESCINNLNDQQWNVIMNSAASIFAPLVAEAMASEVEILSIGDDATKSDGAEVETNGRRITIGAEKE